MKAGGDLCMSELRFSRLLMAALVGGHGLLFLYGLLVGAFGRLVFTDILQMILMGSPMLVVVSAAAFRWGVIKISEPESSSDTKVDRLTVSVVLGIVLLFIFALFVIYTVALLDIPSLKVDGLKISVGAVETALGGYIATIRDKFFPDKKN